MHQKTSWWGFQNILYILVSLPKSRSISNIIISKNSFSLWDFHSEFVILLFVCEIDEVRVKIPRQGRIFRNNNASGCLVLLRDFGRESRIECSRTHYQLFLRTDLVYMYLLHYIFKLDTYWTRQCSLKWPGCEKFLPHNSQWYLRRKSIMNW